MKKALAVLLVCAPLAAQTINPNQIRPSAINGQVLTTVTGQAQWAGLPFSSLTTTGTSGAATLSGGVLNIPVYSGGSAIPTCTTGQMLYYSADGSTATCLDLGTNLSISGGTLNAAGGGGSQIPSNAGVVFTGSSVNQDDSGIISTHIPISTMDCNSTVPGVCIFTNTGDNKLHAGDWIDLHQAGDAGNCFWYPSGTQPDGTGTYFQQIIPTGLSATQFEFNYSLNSGTATGCTGYVESAMGYFPFSTVTGPGFPSGVVNNTSIHYAPGITIQSLAANYSTVLHPYSPAVVGHPVYLVIEDFNNDLYGTFGVCNRTAAQIEGDYTTIFQDAQADGYTIVTGTMASRNLNTNCAIVANTVNSVNTWMYSQLKTPTNGGYIDLFLDLAGTLNDISNTLNATSNGEFTSISAKFAAQDAARVMASGISDTYNKRQSVASNGVEYFATTDYSNYWRWKSSDGNLAASLGTNTGSTYPGYFVLQGREQITAQPNAGFNSGNGGLSVTLTGDSMYEPTINHLGTSFTPSGGNALLNFIRDDWKFNSSNYDGMRFGFLYNAASSTTQNFAALNIYGDTLDVFHGCPGGRFAVGVNTVVGAAPDNGCPDASALFQVGNAAQWKIATNGYPTLSGCAAGTYLKADGSGCGTPSGGGSAFSGGLGTSYQDVTEIAAPSNPAPGNDRLYLDSTSHQLSCLSPDGANCMPTTSGSFTLENGGTSLGAVTTFNCSTGTTCSIAGSTGTITASGSGSSTKLLDNPIDAVPGTANAMDDEWTGETSLNAKWTAVYNSSGTTQFINSQTLYMTQPVGGPVLSYMYQTAPATPWTVTTKIKPMWSLDNYRYAGLVASDSTGQLETFYLSYNNGYAMQVLEWSNGTTPGSAPTCTSGSGALVNTSFAPMYMSLQDDGTNLTFKYSYNGIAWNTACVTSRTGYLTSGPTRVGLMWGVNNGINATGIQDGWFRRTQ